MRAVLFAAAVLAAAVLTAAAFAAEVFADVDRAVVDFSAGDVLAAAFAPAARDVPACRDVAGLREAVFFAAARRAASAVRGAGVDASRLALGVGSTTTSSDVAAFSAAAFVGVAVAAVFFAADGRVEVVFVPPFAAAVVFAAVFAVVVFPAVFAVVVIAAAVFAVAVFAAVVFAVATFFAAACVAGAFFAGAFFAGVFDAAAFTCVVSGSADVMPPGFSVAAAAAGVVADAFVAEVAVFFDGVRAARGFVVAECSVEALDAGLRFAAGVRGGVSFVSTSAVRSSGEEVTVLRYQWAAARQGPTRQSDTRMRYRCRMQGGCRGCALRVYSVTKWQQGPLGPGLPRRNR
ncbi:hypothetical protein [Microbacterium paraoxydans]|uniref:hypothetical protein n=1 Tax=Microbacterium paraoxydans TaxID=199592 RepID=UPI0020113D11|nr:hypothetical protein [Microbacterium paraoxydans]